MNNDELLEILRSQKHPGYGVPSLAEIAAKPDRFGIAEKPLATATKARYTRPVIAQGVVMRFPRAMREIAKVSMFGTQKHEVSLRDMSYLDVPDAENMFADAEMRHMVSEVLEGPIDLSEETRPFHKAQKAWNALADLEVFLRNREALDKGDTGD